MAAARISSRVDFSSFPKAILFRMVSLIKWMPLTDEPLIPVPADWVVTIVEPKEKLKEMFIEEVLENGKNNQDTSTNESATSD